MRTLVLGGYGNFGARICRVLSGDPAVQLLIGGRNPRAARSLAIELGHGAEAAAVDHSAPDFARALRHLRVDLLIHTAGPFQQQDYGVAAAAASVGAHYIDLADGRRFVCDFPLSMDTAFRTAGRTAVTGASTVPALSSAVIDSLCDGWQRIDRIETCIAPAQTAPRGVATLAAVLSYCGEWIQVWDDGRWQSYRGWLRPEPVRFARLRPRLGALCDIPDLEIFPERYRVTNRVMFRAAVEVTLAQKVFAAMAAMRASRLLLQPARLARMVTHAARALDFLGSALGGMVVCVEGVDTHGRATKRAWHIAADKGHGPEIPCMATILLARRLAHGDTLPVGARACVGLVPLAEFAPEFARWGMVTDTVDESSGTGTER